MQEVEIRQRIENVQIDYTMGLSKNQSHKTHQMYYVGSGDIVPDGVYTLMQGNIEKMCSVTGGQVRGHEWVDDSQPTLIRR